MKEDLGRPIDTPDQLGPELVTRGFQRVTDQARYDYWCSVQALVLSLLGASSECDKSMLSKSSASTCRLKSSLEGSLDRSKLRQSARALMVTIAFIDRLPCW